MKNNDRTSTLSTKLIDPYTTHVSHKSEDAKLKYKIFCLQNPGTCPSSAPALKPVAAPAPKPVVAPVMTENDKLMDEIKAIKEKKAAA